MFLERSSVGQRAIVAGVTFAALALLGLVLAYWTWAWLAPRPVPRVQQNADQGRSLETANGLFGGAQVSAGNPPPTQIAIALLGVVAASGGRTGYAVLRLDSKKTIAVPEGKEIEPGVRLAEVRPDHVVLERNGMRETLAWPRKQSSPAPFPSQLPGK